MPEDFQSLLEQAVDPDRAVRADAVEQLQARLAVDDADPQLLESVQQTLLGTMQDPQRPAVQRAAAGNSLAAVGDPRDEVMTIEDMQFCWVPAGPFMMGEAEEVEDLTVAEYWIACYPVTVAQWRIFVEEVRFKVGDEDSLRGAANHPVVNVSWEEANAFCKWMTERARREGWIQSEEIIRLPTEVEWEKAARGGVELPLPNSIRALRDGFADVGVAERQANEFPRREYPWGDEFDADLANVRDTGIGSTNAVGCFPAGVSPYDVEELSGNVWEWTASKYKPDEVDINTLRVLRGGAFLNSRRGARCAVRLGNHPLGRNRFWGCRPVVSPLPLDSDPSEL